MLVRQNLGRALADTACTDSDPEGREGRLHTSSTWWTCYGGPPDRYSLGPADETSVMACEFLDMLRVLRPADELESIAGLRRRAEGIGSWPLSAVADVREQILLDLFAAGEEVDKQAVFHTVVRGQTVLRRWYEEVRPRLTDDVRHVREKVITGDVHQFIAGTRLFRRVVPVRRRPLSI